MLAIGVAAASLAACAAAPSATEDALSTWQSAPLPPDPQLAQVALANGACGAGQVGQVHIVLQDRRTVSTAAFLTAEPPAFSGSCMVTLTGGAGGGSGRLGALDPLTDAIAFDERSTGGVGNGKATLLGGRTRGDVASVEIQLPDGRTVQASVGGGHWLAWWPGDVAAKQVVVRDLSGAVLATLNDTTPGFEVK